VRLTDSKHGGFHFVPLHTLVKSYLVPNSMNNDEVKLYPNLGNIGGSGHNWNHDTKCTASIRTKRLSKLWRVQETFTHAFEKNVISGQWNPGDTPPIRELLSAYVDDVNRILLGGPDY
jgi:hypothetical protein